MAIPARNASPASILAPTRVFFATTQTSMRRRLLQSERNAHLLIDVLRSLVAEHKFQINDFVIMPDHLHVLLTLSEDMTIEKAMQHIKGRFSRRLTLESGNNGEIWQRGFTEVQVLDRESFLNHRAYIAQNPVNAGLVDSPDLYPFCFESLAREKSNLKQQAGAEAPESLSSTFGTTEVMPLHSTSQIGETG